MDQTKIQLSVQKSFKHQRRKKKIRYGELGEFMWIMFFLCRMIQCLRFHRRAH